MGTAKKQTQQSLFQNQGIPSKAGLKGCPLLVTSRPSKLYEIRLKYTETDRCMKINGIKDRNELAKLLIMKLNKQAKQVKRRNDDQLNKLPSDDDAKDFSDFENANKACSSELENVLGCSLPSEFIKWMYFKKTQISECTDNPLLLIISVCIWYKYEKIEQTLAGKYSQMFRYLIEHTLNTKTHKIQTPYKENVSENINLLPKCLNGIVPTQFVNLMRKLARFSFDSLFNDSDGNESKLVFAEETLKIWFTDNDLQAAVNYGILSKESSINQPLNPLTRMTKMSFLHESFQEYLSAVHIVDQFQNGNMNPLEVYQKYCCSTETIIEMENVILFVCGLDPRVASKMSLHVQCIARKTEVSGCDLTLNFFLPLQCTVQVHKFSKEYPSTEYPIHTEILLLFETMGQYSQSMDYIYNMLITNITNLKQIHIKSNHVVKNILNCQLPFSLTICVLQDLDLSGFSAEQLITFGHSLEQIKELRSLQLIDIKQPYHFTLYLQNCRKLKNIMLDGIDLIDIFANARRLENIKIYNCSIDLIFEGEFLVDVPLSQIINLIHMLSDKSFTAENVSVESESQILYERATRSHIDKCSGLSLKYNTKRKKFYAEIKHGNLHRNNAEHFLKILKDVSYLEIQVLDIHLSDGNNNTSTVRMLNIPQKVLDDLLQVVKVSGLVLINSEDMHIQENEKSMFSHRKLKNEVNFLNELFHVIGDFFEINFEDLIGEGARKETDHFDRILLSHLLGDFPLIDTSSRRSDLLIFSKISALESEFLIKCALSTERITRIHISIEEMEKDLLINLLKCRHLHNIEIKLSGAQLQLADILECELNQKHFLMLHDNHTRFSLDSGTMICSLTNTQETENVVRFVTKSPDITKLTIETETIKSESLQSLIACAHLCKIELMLSYIALTEIEEQEIERLLCLHSKCVEFDKKLHSGVDDARIALQRLFNTTPLLKKIHNTFQPVHLSIYSGWRESLGKKPGKTVLTNAAYLFTESLSQLCNQ